MGKAPLYSLIACAIYSAQNHKNNAVADTWREIAEKYVKENFYPHGRLLFEESEPNKIVILDRVTLYDDAGGIVGTYDFTVTIVPDLCFEYNFEIIPEEGFPEEYKFVLEQIGEEYSIILSSYPKQQYYPKVLGWDPDKQPYPEIVTVEEQL